MDGQLMQGIQCQPESFDEAEQCPYVTYFGEVVVSTTSSRPVPAR